MVRPAFFILQRYCLLKVLPCCFVFDIASSGVIFSRHPDAVIDLFRLWLLLFRFLAGTGKIPGGPVWFLVIIHGTGLNYIVDAVLVLAAHIVRSG